MRHAILLLAMAVPALFSGPAQAEITIHRAEYAAGVLVVRGEASEPNQVLTLDERYTTTADRNKDFTFRIRYLPRDCMVKIEAGQEARPAIVTNCQAAMGSRGMGSRSSLRDMSDRQRDMSDRHDADQLRDSDDGERDSASQSREEAASGVAGSFDDAADATMLRVVRQPCEAGQECRVTCRKDEFAVNAFCPSASAKLMSERTVSCGSGLEASIVAYCVSVSTDD